MGSTVRDNPDESRYEIHDDGQLAGFSTYQLDTGRISFIHTEIGAAFTGRGLAGQLVSAELDDARRRGLAVLPFCPLVRQYIADHSVYLDLVPPEDRGRFDLPADPAPQ